MAAEELLITPLYPIIFPDKGTTIVEFNISLPDNKVVSSLPERKKTRRLRSEYELGFYEAEDGVSVRLVNHRKSRKVGVGQYLNFRTYMDRLDEDNTAEIVISAK